MLYARRCARGACPVTRRCTIGLVLKAAVAASAAAGIVLQAGSEAGPHGASGSLFYYFTIQSNMWIGAAALAFGAIDLASKGRPRLPQAAYALKFMFTSSICLTFAVFSILLAPLMPRSYLLSPSNILLHNLTAFLAAGDFLACDADFRPGKASWLLASAMPGLYLAFILILSASGPPRFSGKPVPYFFLDYEKLGWFRVGKGSLGAAYWIAAVFVLASLIGAGLLKALSETEARRGGRREICSSPGGDNGT